MEKLMHTPCFNVQGNIYLWEHQVFLARCCRFLAYGMDNITVLNYEDIPLDKSDEELKQFFIAKLKEVPKTFRQLEYGTETYCSEKCIDVYKVDPKYIAISRFGCNLKCPMCGLWQYKTSKTADQLYFRLLNIFGKDEKFEVGPTFMGEPFLCKKELFEVFKNAKNVVRLTSNMTLLNNSDIEFLKTLGKEKVLITASIDSVDVETYKKIRVGATDEMFHRVLKNTEALNEVGMIEQVSMVVTEFNLDFNLLEDVVNWCRDRNIRIDVAHNSNDPKIIENPEFIKFATAHKGEDVWRL